VNHSRLPSTRLKGAGRPAVALLVVSSVFLVTGCGTRLSHDAIRAGGQAATAQVLTDGSSAAPTTGGDVAGQTSGGTTGVVAGSTGAVGSTTTGTVVGGSTGAVSAGSTGGAGGTTGGSTGGATGVHAAGTNVMNLPIFGGNAPCQPATGSTVKLGNVSTLSGVLGELFSPVVPALQTFVKSQNACGGLNGHKIELVFGDDQGDPSTAVSVAQRQIQNDHILAFVGNIQVLTVDAMVDVVNKSHVPIIGGDLTNNTWFTQPLLFPQGAPPQAISYGYLQAATKKYRKTVLGDVFCLEVPQACTQIDKAFQELAPKFGAQSKVNTQVSITSPSYTSQCTKMRDAKVQVVALTVDAATQGRWANSCVNVGYKPQYLAYPLGVGNEKQFLGNPNLGNTYVPLNTFAWMASSTPAEKYWQSSVARFNPGFTSGDAAGLGWTSGALLVAASTKLTATPTTQQFLDALWTFKGSKSTTLGGLTAPLTFAKGGNPKVPYCLFAAISNSNNSGWQTPVSVPACTSARAPSDPNR
jgi:branched-chain amino acid transport system substrate-binding protein